MEVDKRHFTDYFELLEVSRDASKGDIQKAFMLKASIWHPDKAETDADREYFTKIYQDLQMAYKILSNEHSRKQYIDTQQTTDLEFKFAERNVGYCHTDKFRTGDGRFDKDAFQTAFEQTRSQKDMEAMQQLQQSRYGQRGTVTGNDLQSLMNHRDSELSQLNAETAKIFSGTDFDPNCFNRAFDYMKEKNPGKGVQPYEGDPVAMFSGGGLEECDPMSGVMFHDGTNFTGRHTDDMVLGQSINPGADFDLKAFQTGEQYGQEQKLTNDEIQRKLSEISSDRERLATMDKVQFVVEPSEIEKLYSDLFQPMDNIEQLEAPVHHEEAPPPPPRSEGVLRDSGKIRKKIEQKSKIEKKK